MLRSAKGLQGYKVLADDGEIGRCAELLFDDREWTIRYLAVELGTWLVPREVLISPVALKRPFDSVFPVNLTKKQVEESPDIDSHQPVSRRKELEINRYYGWPLYWGGAAIIATEPVGVPPEDEEEEGDPADVHLRTTREVRGYVIAASDGLIGHVDDSIIDDNDWRLRYFVVDTGAWVPGRKVLVSTEWADTIEWADGSVSVSLTRDDVRHSPHFDPAEPVNREYEEVLYDYYGRPKYWGRP
jgi:hypothetical protein